MSPRPQTVVTRRNANHSLHVFLSIITCGLWAITGWPIAAAMGRKTKTTMYPGPPQQGYSPPPGQQPPGWGQPPAYGPPQQGPPPGYGYPPQQPPPPGQYGPPQ